MASNSEQERYEDAAVVALLRNLDRVGKQREILNELSPREQQKVFEAEARHNRRRGR